MESIKTRVLYPGTFDPITNGHADLVARAARLFHEVIVGVAQSTIKNTMFSLDKRLEMAETVFSQVPNVQVRMFDGLVANFADQIGANVMLRGVRSLVDFENEFQRANVNRILHPGLDTILMSPGEGLAHISSSLVREITIAGGDAGQFVHPTVRAALAAHSAQGLFGKNGIGGKNGIVEVYLT